MKRISMKIWNYESKGNDNLARIVDKDPDLVYTKPEMAEHLLFQVKFRKGDKVMEPCRGKGAFYNALPDYVDKFYCEINEGIDYLKQNQNVDITLSNPPFVPRKLFWSFNQKAMETTNREIYWLLNISSLNVFTPNRLEEMKEKNWYIQNFHIVSDKRWFGRYVWMKISKEPNNLFTYIKKLF